MVMPTVATELTKIALTKLAELKPDDLARAAKALGKVAGRGSLWIPGLGAFGAGLAVGAGIGWLTAPRTGRETREQLMQRLRSGVAVLTGKRETESEPLPASEESVRAS